MTIEELFLFTLDELDGRLELRRGEYDALSMAWLLRKLFLSGERSLVALTGRTLETEPTYRVATGYTPDPTYTGVVPLLPEHAPASTELSTREFLDWQAFGVLVNGASPSGPARAVSVADVIAFAANTYGAVHIGRPTSAVEKALWDYTWSSTHVTPEGQFSAGVYALIGIAKVTVAGLGPWRIELTDRVWPEGFPEMFRGARKTRDPANYGIPTPRTAEPQ